MVRVVLGEADPRVFADAAPGAKIKLAFPEAGTVLDAEGLTRCPRRSYTVRAFRTAGEDAPGELDVDVVVHPGGLASDWAVAASPGDPLGVSSPSSGYRALPGTDVHLLMADETGLPAVAAVVEALPPGARAVAVVEVADAGEEQDVAGAADVTWQWVHRGDQAPGAALEATVTGLPWPAGSTEQLQAFLAAESGAVRRLQRHLTDERGLDPQLLHAKGYWKAGSSKAPPGVRRPRSARP